MFEKSTFFTHSPVQTKRVGKLLAEEIRKTKPGKEALVLGLVGDLGGGKTTFLQGFARGLAVKEKILSPTFVILKRFRVPGFVFRDFYHVDCYRIKKPKELLDLGFKKLISSSRNIVAVEWADRIKKIMPQGIIWLNFEFIDEKTRKIVVQSGYGGPKKTDHP